MSDFGLYQYARNEPHKLAVLEASGRRFTRGELIGLVNRTARALRERGRGRGDVLAIIAPNCAEFIAVYLAATRIGMYVLPINWHLSQAEVTHILRDSGAGTLVVHERQWHCAREALISPDVQVSLRISIGAAPGCVELYEFGRDQPCDPPESSVYGRTMMYTSATTGRPKGVVHSLERAESALLTNISHVAAGMPRIGVPVNSDQFHLCCSMLYHNAPLDQVLFTLHIGNPVLLMETWQPEEALRLIERYQVRTTFMVPTMFVQLLKLPLSVREQYGPGTLKLVSHGAAACPRDVKQLMMDWFGPILWEGYGASEGGGTLCPPDEWLKYPGTVGRAFPGGDIKILDEQGQPLPPGSIGLVYMKSYTQDRFKYRNDPDKTRAAYAGDYFTAGDMGYLNEEGYLFITDRRIDMIISGGMNIYPAEVERVLILHPEVMDCAVFGVPDAVLGEAVQAAVQLRPGVRRTPRLTLELLRHMSTQLAFAKLPRRISYVERLPRDPSGKLFKRLLRDPNWEGYRAGCAPAGEAGHLHPESA